MNLLNTEGTEVTDVHAGLYFSSLREIFMKILLKERCLFNNLEKTPWSFQGLVLYLILQMPPPSTDGAQVQW